MTTTTFFIIFVPILSVLLLAINLLLAPHNPYQEKDSVFECGFHSFLGQNRTQFSVSFFIFGLLFLLFDLEILLVYPYSVSSYTNDIYGLTIMMVFFVLLTLGFIFELGKNALTIDSKQNSKVTSESAPDMVIYDLGKLLRSDMGLSEIISQVSSLLPQLAGFIQQFNTTVVESNIVVEMAKGDMNIDVPYDMPDDIAEKIKNKIGVIDRLINTQGGKIKELLEKGVEIENNLRASDPSYKSQLTQKILEFRRLNESYIG